MLRSHYYHSFAASKHKNYILCGELTKSHNKTSIPTATTIYVRAFVFHDFADELFYNCDTHVTAG